MTMYRLTDQLQRAEEIGDHAAVTMLLARIRLFRGREIRTCRRCGATSHIVCNRAPLSELEMRYRAGDR